MPDPIIFRKEINQAIAAMAKGPWDQLIGAYSNEKPCCVGAKLANLYQLAKRSNSDYIRGLTEFHNRLGVSYLHLIIIFRDAGCGTYHPFKHRWKASREEVLERLSQIEKVPSLNGTTFSHFDLVSEDLSDLSMKEIKLDHAHMDYADLSGSDLSGADLSSAWMEHTICVQTNFRDANLKRTSFRNANLEGADFTGANINQADFRGAKLQNIKE